MSRDRCGEMTSVRARGWTETVVGKVRGVESVTQGTAEEVGDKTTREKEVNGNEKKRERTRDRRRATVVVFGLAGTTIQKTLVERTSGVAPT